ncbi:MAG: hypothetical protein GY856_23600, partial [bacterium]|nr:hypothetical protein [bacterium]
DDGPASESWTAGRSDQVGYWLLAQDDPPDPWADLGLRSGLTFLDFEGTYDCRAVSPTADPPVTATLAPVAGYRDTALQLDYDLGAAADNWAQIRCDFSPQLDLSAFDHLRFAWRGSPGARNSLEVGFIDEIGNLERIFIRGWAFAAHRDWWGQLVVPFDFINPAFNPARVKAFLVSVKNAGEPDVGGAGSLAIDNPGAYNVRSRAVPADFESTEPNPVAAAAASAWLATQQQPSGFLKSWEQETACAAHVYPQALALLVFAHEGRWTEADAVVGALVGAQNANGSWFQSYDCDLQPLTPNQWEGDVAWAVYALSRYLARGGAHPEAAAARDRAADWLTGRINPADGCLVIDHTEGTIDAWWALDAAGPSYAAAAAGLESCLLDEYWDEQMGRFKGGRQWWQPYLDNQTWGAAFLHAVGRSEDARRALSYAWEVLRLPAQSGQLVGLDGQGGPWSIWNEGIGQYVAAGGFDAENLVQELLAQQRPDGAVIGAPDHFLGGGVWTPRWYGVAPTAWLYFALTGGPFGCVGGAETLCLNHQRFEVRAAWRNFRGETGSARAVRLTGDTGYFWFFNRDNVEMVIKVLDACGLNERFWVFAGGLTNVEVEITVTDTSTGAETTYVNPQGTPFQPIQDTAAFATCPSGAKGSGVRRARSAVSEPAFGEASFAGCVPTATTLCLNDDRFQVEVDWEAPGGSTGLGQAESLTSDTGYLWFFNRDNVEMVIKVLDACAVNGRFWVFAGGLTNVEVGIAVTDTATGVAATYVNPQGTAFQPIQDTATFATCLGASFAGSET